MLPLLLLPRALAATWTVDAAGGGDFVTLADAVSAAADGDELQIAAGSFVEDVALGGKSLTLTGAGSGSTWIFGTTTALDLRGSTEVTVSGVTVYGGTRGVDADGVVHLADVSIEGTGSTSTDGGAMRLDGGVLDWTAGGIVDTVAANGGLWAENATITLDGVDFKNGDAGSGGGLWLSDCDTVVTDAVFASGSVSGEGGAVWAELGALDLVDSAVLEFTSGGAGGCVLAESAEVTVSGTSFEGCTSGSPGGALVVWDGTLAVADSSFEDDTAPAGEDIYTTDVSPSIVRSSFSGSAPTGYSSDSTNCGGIWLDLSGQSATLESLVLAGAPGRHCAQLSALSADSVTLGDLDVTSESGNGVYVITDVAVATGAWDVHGAIWVKSDGLAVSGLDVTTGAMSNGKSTTIEFQGEGTLESLTMDEGFLEVYGTGPLTMAGVTMTDAKLYLHGSVEGSALVMDQTPIELGYASTDTFVLDDVVTTSSGGTSSSFGAITLDDGGSLTLSRLRSVGTCAAGSSCPGLWVKNGDVELDGAWFGGGRGTEGGAIHHGSGDLTVMNAVFVGNDADEGGAVWSAGSSLTMDSVIFQENSATSGGALYVDAGAVQLRQLTAVGNVSGTRTLDLANAYAEISDAIVSEDTTGAGLGADAAVGELASTLRFNDVYGNATTAYDGTLTDRTGTDGNLASDPLFVAYSNDGDPTNDDLRLQAGSPCLDAGYPLWTDDDGTRADIGAFGGAYGAALDGDGDFILAADGDCDDADPAIFPGASEVEDDGIDQDCDGADLTTTVDTGTVDTGDTTVDTGTVDTGDTAVDTGDTAVDTGTVDTGDTTVDTGDTAVDTGTVDTGDTAVDSAVDTGTVDTGGASPETGTPRRGSPAPEPGCGCAAGAPGPLAAAPLLALTLLLRRRYRTPYRQ